MKLCCTERVRPVVARCKDPPPADLAHRPAPVWAGFGRGLRKHAGVALLEIRHCGWKPVAVASNKRECAQQRKPVRAPNPVEAQCGRCVGEKCVGHQRLASAPGSGHHVPSLRGFDRFAPACPPTGSGGVGGNRFLTASLYRWLSTGWMRMVRSREDPDGSQARAKARRAIWERALVSCKVGWRPIWPCQNIWALPCIDATTRAQIWSPCSRQVIGTFSDRGSRSRGLNGPADPSSAAPCFVRGRRQTFRHRSKRAAPHGSPGVNIGPRPKGLRRHLALDRARDTTFFANVEALYA